MLNHLKKIIINKKFIKKHRDISIFVYLYELKKASLILRDFLMVFVEMISKTIPFPKTFFEQIAVLYAIA